MSNVRVYRIPKMPSKILKIGSIWKFPTKIKLAAEAAAIWFCVAATITVAVYISRIVHKNVYKTI